MGALGPVFRTYEPTRDRLVAVKVFRLDVTPEQAQSLADELSVAADAGLFHPSVVEPIAAGVEGTVAYRAEEYVAAETLDVALRHYAPAPIDKVVPLIAQLAGAIDFARTAGIGHGALHPRDIFVTPEEARATGFGIVEALERVGLRAPVRRPYSAPERVLGAGWGTPADVFSLAAIAYELLTGRRPAGTGSQIGAVTGSTAGHHPGALHAVFVEAMDEDPARRYKTALAFASALDAAARGLAPAGASAPVAAAVLQPTRVDTRADNAPAAVAPDFDDVLAEKEEDEAHDSLLRAEAAAGADLGTPDRPLFEDDEALEDLALDAPAVADTERFADEFGLAARELPVSGNLDGANRNADLFDSQQNKDEATSREADVVVPAYGADRHVAPVPGFRDAPVDERSVSAYHHDLGDGQVRHDVPSRSLVLPVILALVLGLLIGAAGYAWFIRSPEDPAPSVTATGPTAEKPAAGTAKPYSEGTIAPTPTPNTARAPTVAAEKPAPAPAAPAAPKVGRVVVSSTPRGAGVTIDGRWRGRTPLTLEDVPFGSHEVRVVESGYSARQERFTLSPGKPSQTLSFRLQRSAAAAARPAPTSAREATGKPQTFTGSIYVDSRPRGARVFLDGKPIGTSPLRIPEVRIGSHIIRLQLEDHSDWTTSTRVVSGQEARVTGSLERIR